jgi:hypothetical protein
MCASKAACHFYAPFTQAWKGRTCIEDYIIGHEKINEKLCPFTVELQTSEFFYQAIDATYYSVLNKVKYIQKCRNKNGSGSVEEEFWLENRGILVIPHNCWVAIATDPIRILFPSPSQTNIVSKVIEQTKVSFTGVKRQVRALNDHPKGTDLRMGVPLKPKYQEESHEYIDPWGGIFELGSPISIVFWILIFAVPLLAICIIKILIKRYFEYLSETPPPSPAVMEMRHFETQPFTSGENSPMGIPSAPCQSPLTLGRLDQDDLAQHWPYVDDHIVVQRGRRRSRSPPPPNRSFQSEDRPGAGRRQPEAAACSSPRE